MLYVYLYNIFSVFYIERKENVIKKIIKKQDILVQYLLKKSMYKLSRVGQTHVVQGSTVLSTSVPY